MCTKKHVRVCVWVDSWLRYLYKVNKYVLSSLTCKTMSEIYVVHIQYTEYAVSFWKVSLYIRTRIITACFRSLKIWVSQSLVRYIYVTRYKSLGSNPELRVTNEMNFLTASKPVFWSMRVSGKAGLKRTLSPIGRIYTRCIMETSRLAALTSLKSNK